MVASCRKERLLSFRTGVLFCGCEDMDIDQAFFIFLVLLERLLKLPTSVK